MTVAAGPDLDRLVAEKVMGWERCGEDGWYDAAHHYDAGACRLTNPPEKQIAAQRFEPSTNIAHAFEVAERLMALSRSACFHVGYHEHDGCWQAWFSDARDGNLGIANALSPPLAICLAALAALDK